MMIMLTPTQQAVRAFERLRDGGLSRLLAAAEHGDDSALRGLTVLADLDRQLAASKKPQDDGGDGPAVEMAVRGAVLSLALIATDAERATFRTRIEAMPADERRSAIAATQAATLRAPTPAAAADMRRALIVALAVERTHQEETIATRRRKRRDRDDLDR